MPFITSQLPWTTIGVLMSVNCSWQEAVKKCLVHQARVSNHSTEVLIAISHKSREIVGDLSQEPLDDVSLYLALYSMTNKTFHRLPEIPQVQGAFPRGWQGVVLDGNLYILGGLKDLNVNLIGSEEVFLLDLDGHGEWKPCASMQVGRMRFGCGILHNKIYVFGGTSDDMAPIPGLEVYDLEVNAWPSISPLPSLRYELHVVAIGEEQYLYGGSIFEDLWNVVARKFSHVSMVGSQTFYNR